MLCPPPNFLLPVEADDYITELTSKMSDAWSLAKDAIKKAQLPQKQQHDVRARSAAFEEGERVFVFMPAVKSGKAYKLARPFHGPYRVVRVVENGVEVRPVHQPNANPMQVALNRVRKCPLEVSDVLWPQKDVLSPSIHPTTDSPGNPKPQMEQTSPQME